MSVFNVFNDTHKAKAIIKDTREVPIIYPFN